MTKIYLPIIYSQWDTRWSSEKLGEATAADDNIYNYGCVLTDLAMVCKYFGKDETPSTLGSVAVGLILFATSYQLAPLAKDIASTKLRVEALETNSVRVSELKRLEENLNERNNNLISKLEDISKRLDQVIFR